MIKTKHCIIILLIFLICLSLSTDDENAFQIVENAAPSIIGALLGGITAGISIIFGILSTLKDKLPSLNTDSIKFNNSLSQLKNDVFIILICLVFSLLLPYFRITGVPLLHFPIHELLPSRGTFYTALEMTILVISLSAVWDVLSVMFTIFKLSMSPTPKS